MGEPDQRIRGAGASCSSPRAIRIQKEEFFNEDGSPRNTNRSVLFYDGIELGKCCKALSILLLP